MGSRQKYKRNPLIGNDKKTKQTVQMLNLGGNANTQRVTLPHFSDAAMKKTSVVVINRNIDDHGIMAWRTESF